MTRYSTDELAAQSGRGCKTRINAALRAYVEAQARVSGARQRGSGHHCNCRNQ